MAECPLCGERYHHARPDWVSCLRCSGPPWGTRWLPLAYIRVREGAGEEELLSAAHWFARDTPGAELDRPSIDVQLGLGDE